jgi:hypothetical protein
MCCAQLLVEFRFNRRPEPILKPSQPNSQSLTRRNSTDLSVGLSLQQSHGSDVR